MKIFNVLLGTAGLCSVMTLFSCGEEKFINEPVDGDAAQNLSDYTINAVILQADGQVSTSRNWKTEDVFTLWNHNLEQANDFTISSSYDGSTPAASAEFSGQAALADGYRLLAIYPRKEAGSFDKFATLSLPDTCTTEDFDNYAFMSAPAVVSEGKLQEIAFSPLTAVVRFNVTSISNEPMKLNYITLEGDGEILPEGVTLDKEGAVATFTGTRKSITIDMKGKLLKPNEQLTAAVNVLPTASASSKLLDGGTLLRVKLNAVSETTGQKVVYTGCEVTPSALQMDETAFQFLGGYDYLIMAELNKFQVPESGIMVDTEGVHIYTSEGLAAWAEQVNGEYAGKNVMIETEYIKTKELSLVNVKPIEELAVVFDGKGVKLTGMSLTSDGTGAFILNNKGTVKNLTLSGEAAFSNINANSHAGMLVAENNGRIENCSLENVTMKVTTGNGGNVGTLVGYNNRYAVISGCMVDNSSLEVMVNANAGGLVGENYGEIINSSAGNQLTINVSHSAQAGFAGGLVGFNNGGDVKACSSYANIEGEKYNSIGGLIGGTWATGDGSHLNGTVIASYAEAVIKANGTGNVGGLVGDMGGAVRKYFVGCYANTSVTGMSAWGGFAGKSNANSGALCQACYFSDQSATYAIASGGQGDGHTWTGIAGTANIANELAAMNEAIQKAFQHINFKFEMKDGKITLTPTSSEGGGNGSGADFGDGGEI